MPDNIARKQRESLDSQTRNSLQLSNSANMEYQRVPIGGMFITGTATGGVPIGQGTPAPSIEDFTPLPGYESLTLDGRLRHLPPPSYFDPTVLQGPERSAFQIPDISEHEVRSRLQNWVPEDCFYGFVPAKDISITSIQMTAEYHYILETLTQTRETTWEFRPYDGVSPFDGPHNGPAPAAWDIQVSPRENLSDVVTEVPHSSVIIKCPSCEGLGRRPYHTGIEYCRICVATGKLRHFIQLRVQWQNYREDFVSNATGLNTEAIKRVQGFFVINEVQPRAFPLQEFPDPSIAEASRSILDNYGKKFRHENIFQQKQAVKVVPVAVVYYKHKNTEGKFYVYGHNSDRQIYFEDYPQRCCFLCPIL